MHEQSKCARRGVYFLTDLFQELAFNSQLPGGNSLCLLTLGLAGSESVGNVDPKFALLLCYIKKREERKLGVWNTSTSSTKNTFHLLWEAFTSTVLSLSRLLFLSLQNLLDLVHLHTEKPLNGLWCVWLNLSRCVFILQSCQVFCLFYHIINNPYDPVSLRDYALTLPPCTSNWNLETFQALLEISLIFGWCKQIHTFSIQHSLSQSFLLWE